MLCSPGTFQNVSLQTACMDCPAGYSSASAQSTCVPCPRGTFSTGGGSLCNPCPGKNYTYKIINLNFPFVLIKTCHLHMFWFIIDHSSGYAQWK